MKGYHLLTVIFIVVLVSISLELKASPEDAKLTGPYPVDRNTLLLMHFDEGEGENTRDEVTGENSGILGGDGTGTDLPTWTSEGKFGNGLFFDGIDDYLSLPVGTGDSEPDITIELWFKLKSDFIRRQSPDQILFQKYKDDKNKIGIALDKWSARGGLVVSAVCSKCPNFTLYSKESGFEANRWYHVAVVFSVSGTKLYIDGILNDSKANTQLFSNISHGDHWVTIGSGHYKGKFISAFCGIIDEVRISNTAREYFPQGDIKKEAGPDKPVYLFLEAESILPEDIIIKKDADASGGGCLKREITTIDKWSPYDDKWFPYFGSFIFSPKMNQQNYIWVRAKTENVPVTLKIRTYLKGRGYYDGSIKITEKDKWMWVTYPPDRILDLKRTKINPIRNIVVFSNGPGVSLDKILVTTDPDFVPKGKGKKKAVLRSVSYPDSKEVVIDDFESGIEGWVQEESYMKYVAEASLSQTSSSKTGRGAMEVKFKACKPKIKYAMINKKRYGSDKTLGRAKGVAFWVKGDGTDKNVAILLRAGKLWHEKFCYEFSLEDKNWKHVVIPWQNFRSCWLEDKLPEPSEIKDFSFYIRAPWESLSFCIDNITLWGIRQPFKIISFQKKIGRNRFVVEIGNLNKKDEMYEILLCITSPEGKEYKRLFEHAVLRPNGKKQFELDYLVDRGGKYSVMVRGKDLTSGKEVYFYNKDIEIPHLLEITSAHPEIHNQNTIFIDDILGKISFDYRLRTKEKHSGQKIVLRLLNKVTGEAFYSKTIEDITKSGDISIESRVIPMGASLLNLCLTNGAGGIHDVIELRLCKYSKKINPVLIGKDNTLIVGKKPFFPIGFYRGGGMPDYKEMSEAGFNTLMSYSFAGPSIGEIRRINGYGIKHVLNVGPKSRTFKLSEEDKDWIRDRILKYNNEPGLLGWYIADEPGAHEEPVGLLEEKYNFVRSVDPLHPVIYVPDAIPGVPGKSHIHGPEIYSNISDIIWPDPYEIFLKGTGGIRGMYQAGKEIDNCREQTENRKPVMAVLMGLGRLTGNIRLASLHELRYMVHLSVIHGAKGIIFFVICSDGLVDYPAHWVNLKFIGREVDFLSKAILSPFSKRKVVIKPGNKGIEYVLKESGGNIYLIALNTKNKPCEAQITISGSAIKSFNVLSEKRKIDPRENTFTDSFNGNEVHVYTTDPRATIARTIKETIEEGKRAVRQVDIDNKNNLAYYKNGTTAKASSKNRWRKEVSAALLNGIDGASWADNTAKKYPDWVEIILPEKQLIKQIYINSCLQDYQVQYMQDDKWVTSLDIKNNSMRKRKDDFNPPVFTDKIRLYITGSNATDNHSHIFEIKLYGGKTNNK